MDMATALAELGVTEASLDPDTRDQLDRDGYAPLPGVLSAGQLAAIRVRLAELLAAEGDQAGIEVHQEAGADRLADLVNKGPMFQACFTHPRVLACIAHVLGDFKLSSLNFRAALPGHGRQPLHADFGGPVPPPGYQVCNSIWLLDDFTADNGATRVVPGSHRASPMTGPHARRCPTRPRPIRTRSGSSRRPAPSSSSTVTCGTAAPAMTATGPAARCTPTSPAAPTGSNSTRRSTSARKPWRT